MEERFDKFVGKLESLFSKWLDDFEQRPVSTSLKVLLILWIVRWARRNLL